MAKINTYYNGVKKVNEEEDYDVLKDRRKMEKDYDEIFCHYYNPTEKKRLNNLEILLKENDEELRKNGKLNF
jgi:hypothetical protein